MRKNSIFIFHVVIYQFFSSTETYFYKVTPQMMNDIFINAKKEPLTRSVFDKVLIN